MCSTERSEFTDSYSKDKYKFKLRITNNTNSKNVHEYVHELKWHLIEMRSAAELH